MLTRLSVGFLVALAGVAQADAPPDPAAVRVGDSNLVPNGPRDGFSFTFAIHGSLVVGTGEHGDVGNGPGVSLRLGHTMSPDTIFTMEIASASMLHEHAGTLFTNKAGALIFGAQHYAQESLWFREGLGFGGYQRDGVLTVPGGTDNLGGPVGLFGVGVDIVRRHHVVLGAEAMGWLMLNKGGFTTFSGLGLGLSYY